MLNRLEQFVFAVYILCRSFMFCVQLSCRLVVSVSFFLSELLLRLNFIMSTKVGGLLFLVLLRLKEEHVVACFTSFKVCKYISVICA